MVFGARQMNGFDLIGLLFDRINGICWIISSLLPEIDEEKNNYSDNPANPVQLTYYDRIHSKLMFSFSVISRILQIVVAITTGSKTVE